MLRVDHVFPQRLGFLLGEDDGSDGSLREPLENGGDRGELFVAFLVAGVCWSEAADRAVGEGDSEVGGGERGEGRSGEGRDGRGRRRGETAGVKR